MLNEDYSSDTSDEDFIPKGIESESDESLSDDNDEDKRSSDEETKRRVVKKQKKRHKKKSNFISASIEKTDSSKINTAISAENTEENEIEEKKKTDSLWADFLADVEEKPPERKSKPKTSWASILDKKNTVNSTSNSSSKAEASIKEEIQKKPSTVKVTKVFEFAGEEVRVEEEVAADSLEAKKALAETALVRTKEVPNISAAGKRPFGLSSVVGLLDQKKQKLSTLEKTKLDWVNFKSSEGIEDELKNHLNSKQGYLEKQAFLERADLRQFEIEKNLRLGRTSKR